ncbi:hypothetical protein CDAR_193041 [Caerostris darwini]|uniref:Endonuclease/exonuclease/phosphatase domain-containing protein n=1 Tax=Caerostris darwini TaxID=1538125 RepID=A0AAV4U0B0_9ARAC|nr:hypothetical protein CDAR_193041 [Caerostris darwini]
MTEVLFACSAFEMKIKTLFEIKTVIQTDSEIPLKRALIQGRCRDESWSDVSDASDTLPKSAIQDISFIKGDLNSHWPKHTAPLHPPLNHVRTHPLTELTGWEYSINGSILRTAVPNDKRNLTMRKINEWKMVNKS